MIVCFFFFAEVRSGRMSSYDPRSWGHLPKELFASSPSVKRRLGHLLSIWFFLPRLLTPRRADPRVEWMLSFFCVNCAS